MLEINEIIDNDFMHRDVSELVVGDYYLFDMQNTPNGVKLYFYKDGIVSINLHTEVNECDIIDKFEYTSGSLQELVEKLNEH